MVNSEWLSRQTLPEIENGTTCLPDLRVEPSATGGAYFSNEFTLFAYEQIKYIFFFTFGCLSFLNIAFIIINQRNAV